MNYVWIYLLSLILKLNQKKLEISKFKSFSIIVNDKKDMLFCFESYLRELFEILKVAFIK
jgi:hypothetical protein